MLPRVSSASVPLIPSCPTEEDRLLVHAWVMILPGKRDVSSFPPSTIDTSTQQPQRMLNTCQSPQRTTTACLQYLNISFPQAARPSPAYTIFLVGLSLQVTEAVYVEPATGQHYRVQDAPYYGIEQVWNHQNMWAKLRPSLEVLDGGLNSATFGDLANTEEWEAFLEQPCPKVCFSWFCRWHVWHVDVAAHLHAEIWSSPGIFMTPEYPWGAYHWCVGV